MTPSNTCGACPPGFYNIAANKTCGKCNDECTTCDSDSVSTSHCFTCKHYTSGTTCVATCPPEKPIIGANNICKGTIAWYS